MQQQLDTALPAGTDLRAYARLLHRVHAAVLSGNAPPALPRPVIADSWDRARRLGVRAEWHLPGRLLPREELERRRGASPLGDLLPVLRASLLAASEDTENAMLVTDEDGWLLWREGPPQVCRLCEDLGLAEGACLQECVAGTNGAGTPLALDRPLQVYAAEHYVRSFHALTCSGAPVHDPRDGRLVGVLTLSGTADTAHPATLSLVNAVAQLAESQMRSAHHAHLERLRVVAAPLLARAQERVVVVDGNGWTAAVAGTEPVRRVPLPKRLQSGISWIPALGECRVEPLPGGWMLRPTGSGPEAATRVVLDLSTPSAPSISVISPSGEWTRRLSGRHAELLFLMAQHREGRSAAQLAEDLFGTNDREVTVRAEMSRLRRNLGRVMQSRPYRFSEALHVSVRGPSDTRELLPGSYAPAIRRARAALATEPRPG
ncbi:helix-turn-helix domain-containing protein [Halostreptopolyspora alba]|uniref:Transcriptional regulator n=1 Tax=Halostreptopolyspora alba TaxID=2487137 RepID=A0A3N0E291_9ACTN|nr:transcriptional regulator [Nocardiopsaceae bacterium YIM 96095]